MFLGGDFVLSFIGKGYRENLFIEKGALN